MIQYAVSLLGGLHWWQHQVVHCHADEIKSQLETTHMQY